MENHPKKMWKRFYSISSHPPLLFQLPLTSPSQPTSTPIDCSSMDHHPPSARSIIRSEVHSSAIPTQHHFHSASIHPQHTMVSGSTMGGVVVDGDYALDPQMFRGPPPTGSGMPPSHSFSTSGGSGLLDDASPPGSSSCGDGGKGVGRKRSRKRPKTCGVCGDRAKSFHFGGLSCDSCKAFFRRSVQNDAHVAFRCAYDSCCDINISTRKSCQFCRFNKCLSIGMEKSWVMTEEERNALNQQRLEKKQNKSASGNVQSQQQQQQSQMQQSPTMSTTSSTSDSSYTFQGSAKFATTENKEPSAVALQESEYVADVDKMLDYMTIEEQTEIKTVVETYLHAYKEMPFKVSFEEGRRDTLEIIEMFTTILRRFAYFAKLIPDFAELDRVDQGNLLRAAVLEMCLLRGAACFDTENNRWPSSTMESLKDCPQLRVEDMQRLVSKELFEMHITFILHMKKLKIDEPIAMLLIMTVLFSPERVPVENKVKVNQAQEKYLLLLKKYVIWKFGSTAGNRVYPQLLTKLSDLRQLNDFHTEFHLNLDSQEVNAIRKSLEELNLNPYPNWKIVPEPPQQGSSEECRGAVPPNLPMAPPGGYMSKPMMTQALIQSFADRRIPTLLDNPYATFETDLSMIRQVQQTLGSLFPAAAAGLSPAFMAEAQKSLQSTESGSNASAMYHSLLLGAESSEGRPSSLSPRGYSSSTDSADQAFEIMQASGSQEYRAPSLGESSSSSAQLEESPHSAEYHAERFQQFISQGSRSGQGASSVIKECGIIDPTSFLQGQATNYSGSQPTVLRKHSSGPRLPGAPQSVIRTAPPRQFESSSNPTLHHSSSQNAQPISSINRSTLSGWHGGQVHSTNGYQQGSGRIQPPSSYDRSECNDEN